MALDFGLLGTQGLNPLQMATQGYQTGLQNRLVQQQIEAQQQAQIDAQNAQQQQMELMQRAVSGDVMAQVQMGLMAAKNGQETLQAFAMLDKPKRDEMRNLAYRWDRLARGNPEMLKAEIDNRIAALENSEPTPQSQREIAELKAAKLFPDSYLPTLTMGMVAQYDPDKAESYGKVMAQKASEPFEVAKAKAEAEKSGVEAKFAERKTLSALNKEAADIDRMIAQTQDEAERRVLEQQKLGIERQKLALKESKPLSAGAQKISDQFSQDSLDAMNTASMARDIAKQYDQLDPNVAERLVSWAGLGGALGTQFQNLADQYEIVRKKVVQANKPGAGPISDSDLKFMQLGVPEATSDPKRIREWLGKFANIQDKIAVFEDARANWMQQNGNLGRLKEPLELSNGDVIPAGASITDAAKMFRNGKLSGSSSPRLSYDDTIKQLMDAGMSQAEAKKLVGGK